MIVIKFIFVLQVLLLGNCEKRYESKKARLFSFNTEDDDIKIDLEFTVPFISFPVKKTMDAAFGLASTGLPTININPASLALGGAILLSTTVLVPLFIKTLVVNHDHQKYARILEAAEFETSDVLDFASKMVLENRNLRGCALKVACWTGQTPIGADVRNIWNHVLRNKLVSTMINATALEDAMVSGEHGRDCATYQPCSLKKFHKPIIISNIANLVNKLLQSTLI